MPILAAEPNLHPSTLLEDDEELSADAARWWLFHTRPRQEKSLGRDLFQRNLAFYLPLVRRRILIRGRAVYSQVPLFSGYLFLCGSDEDRVHALMTGRIANSIACSDPRQLRIDLQRIERLIQAGVPMTLESRLQPNQSVRIRSGALAGLEGTILKRKNQTRILVSVKMLQQGVSVDIDEYLLEAVD